MTERNHFRLFSVLCIWGLLPLLFLGVLSVSSLGGMSFEWLKNFVICSVAIVLGPLAGPLMQRAVFDSAPHMDFALKVLAYAAPLLTIGLVVQYFKARNHLQTWLQNGLWIVGWFGWFSSAAISYCVYLE